MAESYTVVTEDGYVSQLYRIPSKAGEAAPSQAKPAVFMMAGVICDMNFWTANDPAVTPAFVLAELHWSRLSIVHSPSPMMVHTTPYPEKLILTCEHSHLDCGHGALYLKFILMEA